MINSVFYFPMRSLIATLAAIESLLSAVVADGMGGSRHKPNAELLGQGIANVASGVFEGLPATGAIARTAANIKAGARTPVSGIMHTIWLFIFMLLFAPHIAKIPLAALASILFIDQMMKATQILAVQNEEDDSDSIHNKAIPEGVDVFEIQGPLFFGVAEKLVDTMMLFESPPKAFILRMRYVPIIDAAGLRALEILHDRLKSHDTALILSGVKPQVRHSIIKARIDKIIGEEHIVDHIDKAIVKAQEIINKNN